MLSRQTKDYINRESGKYKKSTGTGIYVVTVKNSSVNLQDYTYKKFSSIGAGPKDVMLVMDIRGDNYHVLQGREVDEVLTNDAIGEMLDSRLEPYFANKDYNKSATSIVIAFYNYLLERAEGQGTATTARTVMAAAKSSTDGAPGHFGGAGIVLLGIFVLLVVLGVRSSRRRSNRGRYGAPYYSEGRRSIRRYSFWQNGNRHGGSWFQSPPSEDNGFNHGDGGSSSGGGAGRHSSGASSRNDRNWGGGGESSGEGAGRFSSDSSSDRVSSEGGDASSSGGVGRHH